MEHRCGREVGREVVIAIPVPSGHFHIRHLAAAIPVAIAGPRKGVTSTFFAEFRSTGMSCYSCKVDALFDNVTCWNTQGKK